MYLRSLLALVLASGSSHLALAAAGSVDFDRQIRPILSDNCFSCHGPDDKKRMLGLHFDTKEGAFGRPGVIVPGDSAHSKMYFRVSNPDEKLRMPPASTGRKLTEAQIGLIKTWIDSGAKWETHWSFSAPVRPELPPVKNESWVRTPIDRFILAKLDSEGLTPSPEANKTTLLRRVTFDLTGLPPTLSEVSAFLADTAPDAYEKVVDRLLASPHYGERMAVPWLDLARYSDTHGYHIDSAREMWPWRDWVIQAFNGNMPYDEFSVEQIAGDMLPNAKQSQVIATGFNRNHMVNFEGGAIAEEYQNEYIVDRIEATSTTWLGVTLGCARCHDHKYDPLSQKEFYSFGAFFNGVPEKGLDGYKGNAVPFLQLPDAKQTEAKNALLDSIKRKDAEIAAAEGAWAQRQLGVPVSDVAAGLRDEFPFEDSLGNRIHAGSAASIVSGKVTYSAGRVGRAVNLEEEPNLSFPNVGAFSARKPFTVSFWLKPNGPSGMTILQKYAESEKSGPGYEVALDYCTSGTCDITIRLNDQGPESGIEVKALPGAQLEAWNHITVAYDGSGRAKGVHLYLNGESAFMKVVRDHAVKGSFKKGDLQVGNKAWGTPLKGELSDLRFYGRSLNANEARSLGFVNPLHAVLQLPEKGRTEEQQKWLRNYFLEIAASDQEKKLGTDYAALNKDLDKLNRQIPSTMVMSEMEKPRDTFVLKRGDYRMPGDKVTPATPAVLPPLPAGAPRNRLTLAKWIVDPGNPLTARVAVNHFWQMYFGLGIVKTSEDFGSQGDPPSHQALLDWLATEFVRTKWDVKAMQRLIVTSAVYRQASVVTPESFERDPENRLLARGPRFRLPAEMVRDNALQVSGLMNDKVGGASVLPYQPKGLWEEMAFGGDFSAQKYEQSHGSDLYRRSMYTFVKRTVPYPGLNTFDAPDREKCSARRTTTNTPLQALLLMNDPTYVEASRALAQRDLKESESDEKDRIRRAFRLATERDPSPRESEILSKLYEKELAHYRADKSAAEKLLSVGESKRDPNLDPAELAAWTLVASTILNMDETITRN